MTRRLPLKTYLCYRLPGMPPDTVAVLRIRSRTDYDSASPEAIDPHRIEAIAPSVARRMYRAQFRHRGETDN